MLYFVQSNETLPVSHAANLTKYNLFSIVTEHAQLAGVKLRSSSEIRYYFTPAYGVNVLRLVSDY